MIYNIILLGDIMNIVDAIIILIILGSGVFGLKRGFTRELVSFIGFFLMIILAFIFKGPLSRFLYMHLPFIPFSGAFKGVAVLNILVYEILSFFILLSILTIILRVVLFATKVFERLLTLTIVLGIPSKILGFVVGLIEGVMWAFIIVYILSLPTLGFKEVNDSKYASKVLVNVPILSSNTKGITKVTNKVMSLKEDYKNKNITKDEFNYEALDAMLEYKVVKVDNVKMLKEQEKINFKGLDKLIRKYGE